MKGAWRVEREGARRKEGPAFLPASCQQRLMNKLDYNCTSTGRVAGQVRLAGAELAGMLVALQLLERVF